MLRAILRFFKNEAGQDLAEYCLLLGFIVLAVAGIIIQATGGIQRIWNGTNTIMASASSTAGGSSSASSASIPSNGSGSGGGGGDHGGDGHGGDGDGH